MTTSEWTLGVFSESVTRDVMALNAAESSCVRERIWRTDQLACIEVWENGVATHDRGVDKGVFKVSIATEKLLVEEICVGNVAEEGDVDGMLRRDVLEGERLESHGGCCGASGEFVAEKGLLSDISRPLNAL